MWDSPLRPVDSTQSVSLSALVSLSVGRTVHCLCIQSAADSELNDALLQQLQEVSGHLRSHAAGGRVSVSEWEAEAMGVR